MRRAETVSRRREAAGGLDSCGKHTENPGAGRGLSRGGHVEQEHESHESTRITRIHPAAAELPVEPWGGTEMQKDAQVESECRDVAAELAAGTLGQPLRGDRKSVV